MAQAGYQRKLDFKPLVFSLCVLAIASFAGYLSVDFWAACSAAFGAGVVLGYFWLGQLIESYGLKLPNLNGMAIVLAGYFVRLAIAGALLWWTLHKSPIAYQLNIDWLGFSALAIVLTWLGTAVYDHATARVPTYDQPYIPPVGSSE